VRNNWRKEYLVKAPRRLGRTVVYKSPWVSLYVDEVQFPNGRIIERHHLLDFGPSVVAFVENGAGQVLMVRICRYTTGRKEWELPAGGVEPGESVEEAARREVPEETSYEITGYEHVYSYYPMNGIANKVAHVIRCQAAKRAADFDRDEVGDVRWFSRDEIRRMIEAREITDGVALIPLLLLAC
jgi:ADP-ribose pyrophosphatase